MFKQFVDCRKDVNKDRLMGLKPFPSETTKVDPTAR